MSYPKLLRHFIGLLGILCCSVSCQCSGQKDRDNSTQHQRDFQQVQQDRIEAERDFLEKERASIEAYIKDRDLEVERTGTGLYYQILENNHGEKAQTGDEVVFTYEMFLMNGTSIYLTEEEHPKKLLVDKEDAEIGLHESLKKMGVGDKGLFILPSHLAFGVGGDQVKIPPKTALVYEIKVLEINKL